MRQPTRVSQPRHFAGFHCLGADCEDTCCDGWAIAIDRPTYEKYRQHPDPQWRASFEKLITIKPADATEHDYARIQLAGTTCPFLTEGLCSIHKTFGEEYLSVTCASFPRVWNVVDHVLEKSLDVGCPEAARAVLLDPGLMAFEEGDLEVQDFSMARIASLDTAADGAPGKPYRHFTAVRQFVLELLRKRELPLWKRLLILGLFCDKVQEASAAEAQLPGLIAAYRQAVSENAFDSLLDQLPARPVVRLETVLELIVARIHSDFTNRRFLQLYKEFMQGIEWGPQSSMDELGGRCAEAAARVAAPFLSASPHLLEQYLVNYVYRTLFPFGPRETTYGLRAAHSERSIHAEFMLLAVHHAIIETLLAGLAGFYQDAFGEAQVIQVVYTVTRTFEHSLAFPEHALRALAEKGLDNVAGAAVLVRS